MSDKARSLPDLGVDIRTDDEDPPSPAHAVTISIANGRCHSFAADDAERIGKALIAAAADWRAHAGIDTRCPHIHPDWGRCTLERGHDEK